MLSCLLVDWGFCRSRVDLYVYSRDSELILGVVRIDDCVIVNRLSFLRAHFRTECLNDLGKRFPVDDKGPLN